MDRKTSAALKNRAQKKKPLFRRQEIHHQQMLKDVWRSPRGHRSKLRLKLKPRGAQPSIGFSPPGAVRGLDPKGRQEVLIANISDLSTVRNETDIAVIRSAVGQKKRAAILQKAAEKNIPVKN